MIPPDLITNHPSFDIQPTPLSSLITLLVKLQWFLAKLKSAQYGDGWWSAPYKLEPSAKMWNLPTLLLDDDFAMC